MMAINPQGGYSYDAREEVPPRCSGVDSELGFGGASDSFDRPFV